MTGRAGGREELPLDPAVAVPGTSRSPHLQWRLLGLVGAGGAIGTAAREALSLALPPVGGVPLTIFFINVGGAFLLGLLLETLGRRGPEDDRRRALRLFVGTGVLGGFTTYSALATDTALLLGGFPLPALAYALGTVVLGGLASAAGIGMGALLARSRADRRRGADPR